MPEVTYTFDYIILKLFCYILSYLQLKINKYSSKFLFIITPMLPTVELFLLFTTSDCLYTRKTTTNLWVDRHRDPLSVKHAHMIPILTFDRIDLPTAINTARYVIQYWLVLLLLRGQKFGRSFDVTWV
jgi:hypothetical protein